jgi:hypothetical protein
VGGGDKRTVVTTTTVWMAAVLRARRLVTTMVMALIMFEARDGAWAAWRETVARLRRAATT